MSDNKYRHEYKIGVDYFEYLQMKSKLDVLLSLDEHCKENGTYSVCSLYFDNSYDKVLSEKINGVDRREKFRFRYYDKDVDFVRLEKKQKINGLCLKTSMLVKKEDVKNIITGKYFEINCSEDTLLSELLFKMRTQGLRPRNIITYDRRAYIYEPGNVRITLDMNLSTRSDVSNYLAVDEGIKLGKIGNDAEIIMEVKYDEFIPLFISDVIGAKKGRVQAFSKYAQSRKYI